MTYAEAVQRIKQRILRTIEDRFEIGRVVREMENAGHSLLKLSIDSGVGVQTLTEYRRVYDFWGTDRVKAADGQTWEAYRFVANMDLSEAPQAKDDLKTGTKTVESVRHEWRQRHALQEPVTLDPWVRLRLALSAAADAIDEAAVSGKPPKPQADELRQQIARLIARLGALGLHRVIKQRPRKAA